ncbi:DUF4230 domain-containing protein [Nafulsella turpanensis]|uniref:DUF4230 domain-containing protein n=1 Tax=Nafulsella turpanensis TaxID=1265690 RepID=UPI000346CF7D|nr:DUF4230 domain-containing protein [Nafulsella turpanensis]
MIRYFMRWLPWLLALFLLYLVLKEASRWFGGNPEEEVVEEVNHQTVLQEVEKLGRLELVRYNFKEVVELKERNEPYLWVFEVPDSKVLVISAGEAVGCIDLTKMKEQDVIEKSDTVMVRLPEPELCYYKLNMEDTQIYSIEKQVYFKEETRLAEKALRLAERQIKEAALSSDILEETRQNAKTMLKPWLEGISGKVVVFLPPLPEDVPVEKN